jgi:hypothetical protein
MYWSLYVWMYIRIMFVYIIVCIYARMYPCILRKSTSSIFQSSFLTNLCVTDTALVHLQWHTDIIFSCKSGNLSQNDHLASYRKSISHLLPHFLFHVAPSVVFSVLQYIDKYTSRLTCTLIITEPVQNNLLARSGKQQPIFQNSIFTARDISRWLRVRNLPSPELNYKKLHENLVFLC